MIFTPLPLEGAYLIALERIGDERGHFARAWCAQAFAEHRLDAALSQCNISFNARRHTLRGLHWQAAPHPETKLVRCTRGAVWDVIVDLRPASATFRRWHAVELDERNQLALYIPHGFAHGFQTLEDESELFYHMSVPYHPECSRGARWDDPAFAISWPNGAPLLSPRDANHPAFAPAAPPGAGGRSP